VERIKAARGTTLRCKGWRQEAILRMLENNLENAEKPDELIIYGGTGKAARNWDAFRRIVETLKSLRDDETLVVQSGKPVAVFRTQRDAPRVLSQTRISCRGGRTGRRSTSSRSSASRCTVR